MSKAWQVGWTIEPRSYPPVLLPVQEALEQFVESGRLLHHQEMPGALEIPIFDQIEVLFQKILVQRGIVPLHHHRRHRQRWPAFGYR